MTTPLSTSQFNALNGRLRISVTHRCQLSCVFCHQEGIPDHWAARDISASLFRNLLEVFENLGGREVNLTGGEPLLHPSIGQLVEIASRPAWKLALCTNGLLLHRVSDQIRSGKLRHIKLSLHSIDDRIGRQFLGGAWSFNQVSTEIENAISLGADITLNFTHTAVNTNELEAVMEHALRWNTHLTLIDLIRTAWRADMTAIGQGDSAVAEQLVRKFATPVGTSTDTTGCVLKIFQTEKGRIWKLKDIHFGRLFTSMCRGCQMRQDCGEGVFMLRVDANGRLKPCLLRRDLDEMLPPEASPEDVWATMVKTFDRMFPPETEIVRE